MEGLIAIIIVGVLLAALIAFLVLRGEMKKGQRFQQENSQILECRNCGRRFTRGKFIQSRGCPACGADFIDG